VFRQTLAFKATRYNRSNPSAILAVSRTHARRIYCTDRNCGILNGFLVPNLEAGEVVPTYGIPSLHDVHRSGSAVRLAVVDLLGLGYQSSGSFLFALSEKDSSCEVVGYG